MLLKNTQRTLQEQFFTGKLISPAAIRQWALLLVWMLATVSGRAIAHDTSSLLPATIASIKPGVVAVGTMRPVKRSNAERPPVTFKGSGFVVGNGRYVVTNLHVLPESLDSDNDETLAIFSGSGGQTRGMPVKIVRKDELHDLVVLEMQGGKLPALSLAGKEFLQEGIEVAWTGFPIGMVLGLYPVTHRGIVSAVTPLVIPAHNSGQLTAEHIRRLKAPFEVYQLDGIAYPGNSGSAVYNIDSGTVIGVVNSVFVKTSKESALSSPSGITYVIPVKYVIDLLQGI